MSLHDVNFKGRFYHADIDEDGALVVKFKASYDETPTVLDCAFLPVNPAINVYRTLDGAEKHVGTFLFVRFGLEGDGEWIIITKSTVYDSEIIQTVTSIIQKTMAIRFSPLTQQEKVIVGRKSRKRAKEAVLA